jgi:hypothetical protein
MTEEDWLYDSNPDPMLRAFQGRISERQLRLFAIACCRAAAEGDMTTVVANALDAAEKAVDAPGDAKHILRESGLKLWLAYSDDTRNDFLKACVNVCLPGGIHGRSRVNNADEKKLTVYDLVREASRFLIERPSAELARGERHYREMQRLQQADILREIVGNPFQSIIVQPETRTMTVLEVAEAIETAKDWERMPILADALEDAGSTDTALLDHLRSGMSHVRGCWALDRVLGRG